MIFERLNPLFGEDGLQKLANASVAVVGLGGVGGIAAISLARSGVGQLIICDFDVVEASNINRQIVATHSTIGNKKTVVLQQMIQDINPNCRVIAIDKPVDDTLFTNHIDFVIDAIDDIPSKIALIENCIARKIDCISSMGAAKKVDPSCIKIMKLSKTTHDPIAKIIRNHFKNRDFFVVASHEATKCNALGSYMPVVATFGLLLSDYIIKEILRRPKCF